jgi:hypothetical protein
MFVSSPFRERMEVDEDGEESTSRHPFSPSMSTLMSNISFAINGDGDDNASPPSQLYTRRQD